MDRLGLAPSSRGGVCGGDDGRVNSKGCTYEFDRATHLTSEDGSTYSGSIEDGWDIHGNANGGYLLTLAVAAMREASGRPDPITVTAHYLAPGPPVPITVSTEVVKSGRQLVTMTGSLRTESRELLRVLGTFGDLSSMAGGFEYTAEGAEAPDLPPPDQCVLRDKDNLDSDPNPVALANRLRVWMRPEDRGYLRGEMSGKAVSQGWIEFGDERPMDTLGLLLVVDSFPPPGFNIIMPRGWVPTVELTAHIRGIPAPGPLKCRFHTEFIRNGYLQEDGEVWDSTGALVAQSRQLALLPKPSPQ